MRRNHVWTRSATMYQFLEGRRWTRYAAGHALNKRSSQLGLIVLERFNSISYMIMAKRRRVQPPDVTYWMHVWNVCIRSLGCSKCIGNCKGAAIILQQRKRLPRKLVFFCWNRQRVYKERSVASDLHQPHLYKLISTATMSQTKSKCSGGTDRLLPLNDVNQMKGHSKIIQNEAV